MNHRKWLMFAAIFVVLLGTGAVSAWIALADQSGMMPAPASPANSQEVTQNQGSPSRMMGTGMGMQGGMMGMMMGMGSPSGDAPWISMALDRQSELALSPEQIQRLTALRIGFEKESIRLSADIRVAELELEELLSAKQVDQQKARAKIEQIGALRTKLRLSRMQAIENGKGVLSDQQWEKLRNPPTQGTMGGSQGEPGIGGMHEMQQFMQSGRMPQAMAGMMDMARSMGGGDPMLGMVRMMDMMGGMGGIGQTPNSQ